MPHLTLFFTFDVSLEVWKDCGLLSREVALYRQLVTQGWKVTFLTYGGQNDLELGRELDGIDVIPLYLGRTRPKSMILRLLQSPFLIWVARGVLRTTDLYKTNQILGGWNAVFAKWFFKKPLLVRGGFELYSFSIKQGHSRLKRLFFRSISWLAYRNADAVCLATEQDKAFATEQFSLPSDVIEVRQNWVDTECFRPLKEVRLDRALLFVGRFNPQKNLLALVDALGGMDTELHLIGSGEQEEEIKERAVSVGAKLRFLGRVPNDGLPKILACYSAFVLPSHYEGNPKALLEAMSCGCPIVATRTPGIETLVEHEKTGILCDTDAASLREGINWILENGQRAQALGAAARRHILAKNSLKAYAQKEDQLLHDLLKKSC